MLVKFCAQFKYIFCSKVYTPYKFYYASKLYEVTAMLDLDKRMEQEGANIHSYCVHPGLVPTDLWYSAGGGIARIISASLRFIFRVSLRHMLCTLILFLKKVISDNYFLLDLR